MKVQVDENNSLTKRYYLKHKYLEKYWKNQSGSIPDNLRPAITGEGISIKRDDILIHIEL